MTTETQKLERAKELVNEAAAEFRVLHKLAVLCKAQLTQDEESAVIYGLKRARQANGEIDEAVVMAALDRLNEIQFIPSDSTPRELVRLLIQQERTTRKAIARARQALDEY